MTMLPTANHCVMLRLLLLFSAAGAGISTGAFASGTFVLLFAIMTAASATLFSALRGPPAFFQQPFCLQPLALDFLGAAWLELVKSFAVWCQQRGSQVVVVVVVVWSTLFLAMHQLFLCSKGNRPVGCKAITDNYYVIVQLLLCIAQVFLPILLQHVAQQNQCALW